MSNDNAQNTPDHRPAVGVPVERMVSRLAPKRWTVDRLARAATRLMQTFERRTEVAEDVIDAVEVLREQRDMLQLHYLTAEGRHEASQGAYLQAQHLEWQANNNPDPHRRADLIRRARVALAAGDKLRGLDVGAG